VVETGIVTCLLVVYENHVVSKFMRHLFVTVSEGHGLSCVKINSSDNIRTGLDGVT
jgi:hypothetical protein